MTALTLSEKRTFRRGRRAYLWLMLAGLVGISQLHGAGFPYGTYARRPASWFQGATARRIADNIVSHQAPNGGWPKNLDTGARPYTGEGRDLEVTFDNGAMRGELRFLARVYRSTQDQHYLSAFLRGFDLILAAQYDNGGWPQSYPPGRGYSRYITFNDGTMIGLLEFLKEVNDGETFEFLDSDRRVRARRAVARGIHCLLQCQIRVDDVLTVWCAQHDEITLEPRGARSYEHPSLSGGESAGICLFLMSLEEPSSAVVASVNAACQWFEQVQIRGSRVERKADDRLVVADPKAPSMWARFYEIGTNRPIFSGRDGVIRYALADIELERRRGYSWYVNSPARALQVWDDWQAKHATRD